MLADEVNANFDELDENDRLRPKQDNPRDDDLEVYKDYYSGKVKCQAGHLMFIAQSTPIHICDNCDRNLRYDEPKLACNVCIPRIKEVIFLGSTPDATQNVC